MSVYCHKLRICLNTLSIFDSISITIYSYYFFFGMWKKKSQYNLFFIVSKYGKIQTGPEHKSFLRYIHPRPLLRECCMYSSTSTESLTNVYGCLFSVWWFAPCRFYSPGSQGIWSEVPIMYSFPFENIIFTFLDCSAYEVAWKLLVRRKVTVSFQSSNFSF